jgi:hypothetical protein
VQEDNLPFNGHASIVFSGMTDKVVEKKAKKLKRYALERGWQYGPVV